MNGNRPFLQYVLQDNLLKKISKLIIHLIQRSKSLYIIIYTIQIRSIDLLLLSRLFGHCALCSISGAYRSGSNNGIS